MKKAFTLIEILIVVAIIGLLAALGIPFFLGAFKTAQQKTIKRNIASVEKAKGVLTLPLHTVTGAMNADMQTPIGSGTAGRSNLLASLRITDVSNLTVGSASINIGTMTTKASYPQQ